MYPFIDGLQFFSFIGLLIYAIKHQKKQLGITSGILFLFYPVINQLIYNAFTKLFSTQQRLKPSMRHRLVYNQKYNLSFCGLQKLHPFDSQKYGNIVSKLLKDKIVTENQFEKPEKISRSILLEKMSMWYLIKLCYSIPLCLVIEMPLYFLPNFLLRWRVLNPMLRATEGTLIGCQIANQKKWAINLSGGYHHASASAGEGFCVYPDITLAVNYIRTRLCKNRVMIIDLDAHQGNGYQRDLIKDHQIYIIDCYNHNTYPHDTQAKKAIHLDMRVTSKTTDSEYLSQIKKISDSIEQFAPQFIIYNAGTDILKGDRLGGLNLSQQCIIQRDQYIFGLAIKNNIPIVMVLSGGYQQSNAGVIAKSIKNLFQKFDYLPS